jgi:HEAT repeat protein
MGLLDFFGGSAEKKLKKHAARVANKRAQNPDRWESIQALGEIASGEAVEALLVRFTYNIDPSITDQEEKDATVDAIVKAGPAAVDPVKAYLKRSPSIAYPYRILERLSTPEELVSALIELLERFDTEYERDPEKKIQVISALEERQDARIVAALRRFLEDVNETVRFHSVSTILAQPEAEEAKDALLDTLRAEESVRVRARILDGFVDRGWDLGERRDEVRAKLPGGYAIDAAGQVRRK